MAAPEETVREIYVQPGESHVVSSPAILRTVLGSCVGITFLAPARGIGALCHPMLPRCPNSGHDMDVSAGQRYVDFAIRDVAQRLSALGVARTEVEVKVFGGGDVLAVGHGGGRPTVGKLNAEAAFEVLKQEGFNVAACRVGGDAGVHLEFTTASGEVLVRRLNRAPGQPQMNARRKVHRCGPAR